MALATHLADTSVYARIRWPAVAEAVVPLIDRGLVATCSVVDLELFYSARTSEEHMRAIEYRAGFERLDVEQQDWDAATATQAALAARGQLRAVGVADLLIAAVAARHGVVVLHYDRDFDHVGAVTGQPVQWVVPAGTVD